MFIASYKISQENAKFYKQ